VWKYGRHLRPLRYGGEEKDRRRKKKKKGNHRAKINIMACPPLRLGEEKR